MKARPANSRQINPTSRQCRTGLCIVAGVLALATLAHTHLHRSLPREELTPSEAWVQKGFDDFARGQFGDGGSNLYVDSRGYIEMINNWDVNSDGYPDLVLANSHDYIERGPTWVYTLNESGENKWDRHALSAESGWMSRIVDVDGDGSPDLVVVNGENGVTSELSSYVYWGGPNGPGAERTELPTIGAYDVAVMDINHDGRLDLIFPSAWTDHHNPGRRMPIRVFLQGPDRKFTDATELYGLKGVAAVSVASADLNGDGFPDLVVANYRDQFNLDTDSFVYWGTAKGIDPNAPLRLATHGALQVILADLNQDGKDDIIFSGGDQVRIYWNQGGKFESNKVSVLSVKGYSSMFSEGAVRAAIADLDGDGKNELILAAEAGVEIRSGDDLFKVKSFLPIKHAVWVTASDLNGDGRQDLIVSKYDDGAVYDTQSAVFWNGPSGFSAQRVTWFPTKGAVGNVAGQLSRNNGPAVVFNNTMSGHVSEVPSYIYLGNKGANYGPEHRLELPAGGSTGALVADLDLDGYPEVVFTSANGLRVFRGGPNGPAPDNYFDLSTANLTIQDVHVADFNRDGYLDLLAVGTAYDTNPEALAKSSTIFYGSKEGYSTSRVQYVETYGSFAHLADVNRDGYLDILFNDKRGYILIYLGGPDGYSKDRVWKLPCSGLETVGMLNTADLNNDGWLDLIVSTMGHYTRVKDTLHIFFGGPEGFSPERAQHLFAGYSAMHTAVADFNGDGNLDLLVTAYSTPTARVIPAQLFWGNGKTLDLDHPLNLPAEASSGATQLDLNRDGWTDIVLACHRNDMGHQVNSLIYWNGPAGFSPDRVTRLPGLGPHGMTTRDRGNAYTRKPEESYISPPFDLEGRTPVKISWSADVPRGLQLKFQVRSAVTKEGLLTAHWTGPTGEGSYFQHPGEDIREFPGAARWLQFRAIFVSPYGCGSPRLREVQVKLNRKEKN